MKLLDYSTGTLTPKQVRDGGYQGVIRYLPKIGASKVSVLSAGEAASFLTDDASDLALVLVYEDLAAQRALNGYNAGRMDAAWALQQARTLCGVDPDCIYAAIDFPPSQSQIPAVQQYMLGWHSIMGERSGVYGFRQTIQAVMGDKTAHYFWQCGRWSDLVPGVHIYQHNDINPVVSGVECDVNDVLNVNSFGKVSKGMTPEQARMLNLIYAQLVGVDDKGNLPHNDEYPGWDPRVTVNPNQRQTMAMSLWAIQQQLSLLSQTVNNLIATLPTIGGEIKVSGTLAVDHA